MILASSAGFGTAHPSRTCINLITSANCYRHKHLSIITMRFFYFISSTIMATVQFYTWCLQELLKMNVTKIHYICRNTCKGLFIKLEKGFRLYASSYIHNYEGKKVPINRNTQVNISTHSALQRRLCCC